MGTLDTKNVPFLLCGLCFSVLCPLFSIRMYLLHLHPVPFIKSPPIPSVCPLSLLIIRSKQSQWTFSTFQSMCCCSTWQRASSVPGITFSDIILFSSPINVSSCHWADTPPPVGPWFSCRALWVRIQPDFPSAWCHFSLAAWAERGKGKKWKTQLAKTELRNANWLRWNPSGGRWSVSPHIFNQSGHIGGRRRELLLRLEVIPNGILSLQPLASHNNLKTSLWPG